MPSDNKFFNCSEKYEVEYLASKFLGSKIEIIAKIDELCKSKKIHYSSHKQAEQQLINSGFKKK